MAIRNITANDIWTFFLISTCLFSLQPFCFIPRMSMQKEEVNAVSAPSALGNNAEINAIINMIDNQGGKCCIAIVGNKSSPLVVIECVSAYRYNHINGYKGSSNYLFYKESFTVNVGIK